MIGLGAAALWELWQRINQLDQAVHLKRANAPERKRQSRGRAEAGGRSTLSAPGDVAVSEATLDNAGIRRSDWVCRIHSLELHP